MKNLCKKCKWVFLFAIVAFAVTAVVSCGGGGDDNNGGGASNMTQTQKDESQMLLKSLVMTVGGVAGSKNANKTLVKGFAKAVAKEVVTDACPLGGSLTVAENGSITFDQCNMDAGEGISILLNGTISFTESGTSQILTYDLDVAYTDDSGTQNYGESGTITWTGDTFTFNVEGDFDGTIYTVTGSLTGNNDGTITGTITIVVSSYTATCVFDSFNVDTATEEDFNAACGF